MIDTAPRAVGGRGPTPGVERASAGLWPVLHATDPARARLAPGYLAVRYPVVEAVHRDGLVRRAHGWEEGYRAELAAHRLLAAERVLPELITTSDTERSLILQALPETIDLRAPGAFTALVDLVARVHTAPARHPPDEAWAGRDVRAALAAAAPTWVCEPRAWTRVLHRLADAHGADHLPVGGLDLLTAHHRRLRRRPDGRLALSDAATLSPDTTAIPDLLALARVAADLDLPVRGPALRALYRDRVNAHGARWSDAGLITALHDWSAAVGVNHIPT
ncbi:hypothetical protein V5P93_003920 [Actinokineospora auranticolor]|uniref:Uncharacterized protein n=1 Tax=Actinokineospora auranticolor TaxID=155976 RepID=A0A2S6GLT9_9PSEU|nr:hypothetical protein [Actinokineospora auranticolor]PPK66202.1 hypothetical protein CLV40_111166 [Actinokineospora auranticolor]